MGARARSRSVFAVTGALVVGLAFVPPTDARTGRSACRAKSSKTVIASARARIYKIEAGDNFEYFGCLYRTRRRVLLAEGGFGDMEPTEFRLAGHMVGFSEGGCERGGGTCGGAAVVVDLRTRRTLRRLSSRNSPGVGDLELKTNGSVAAMYFNASTREHEVWKSDRNGPALLDSAAEIVPGSLALSGSTLYWTRGGIPVSALLD
jgi:hypothetical protein